MWQRCWGLLSVCLLAALLAGAGCDRSTSESKSTSNKNASINRTIRVLLDDEIRYCRFRLPAMVDLLDATTGETFLENVSRLHLSVEFANDRILLPGLNQSFSGEVLDIIPHGEEPVGLQIETNAIRYYMGAFRLIRTSRHRGEVINFVDIEEYLLGVVPGELPANFHEEAFRVQAICARTYAWYSIANAPRGRSWDVKSTQSSQVYKGVPKKGSSPKSGPGVRDTKGIVLTYATDQGERIFCTYYSSTCGGSNQDAAPVKNEPFVEPLRGGVECDYCKDSPFYRWGPVKLSKRSMTIQLRERYEKFDKLGRIEQIKVHQATPEGRPVILSLIDMEGKAIRLEAENFRLAVDPSAGRLRSNWFTPVSEPDSIIFANGRGFGHGIGMCQYGADTLGRKGWPAGRILRYYYPTALLTRAYE